MWVMARNAAGGFWSHVRSSARIARCWLGGAPSLVAGLVLISLSLPAVGQTADPVKGEASFAAADGYARLVFKLAQDVPSEVTTAGSIVVIRFEHPVDIPVDLLSDAVPDYVASARRDPDGTAIRLSLARRVTINTMSAGERVFVDFLPDTWTGPPPSLPIEVVRELAERARAAERALRLQRATAEAKKRPPIRVRALVQPTFVRFVFEMPDGVRASSVLNDQKLTVQFNSLLNFDLADAKVAAPPNIASINQRVDGEQTLVDITLIGDVDVHSFREEKNYIIDVAFQQADKPKASMLPSADASPAPAPARPVASAKPAPTASPEQHAAEITPPTSETIAAQMKTDAKSELPATPPSATEAAKAHPPASEPPVAEPAPKQATPAAAEGPKKMVEKTVETMAGAPKSMAEAPKTPPEAAKKIAPATAEPAPQAQPQAQGQTAAAGAATVEALRDSDGLRLTFSFGSSTPAASFRRGDTVWVVFDSTQTLDVEPIRAKGGAIIGEVNRLPLEKGQAIRIRLNRPQMHSLSSDERSSGANWTLTFADKVMTPPQPLMVIRNITDPTLANIAIPLSNPGLLHKLVDPDAGDTLLVVTAPPPVRGFIKRQDFVDLALLDSAHGIAIRPNSDSLAVEVGPGKVILGKPGGLMLSPVDATAERASTAVRPIFDIDEWRKNQDGDFMARQSELIVAAGAAEPEGRARARLDLAAFYLSRGLYQEAKAETEFLLSDTKAEEPVALMVHAIANILVGRPAQGLKELANPAIGNNYDSQLWKALAFARQGKWADAREKFKNVEFAIASLPFDLQRIVTTDAMLASLEVRDYAGAAKHSSELDVVGVPADMKPEVAVLRGRLAEALGQDKDALDDYRFAVASPDRQAAAGGKQLEIGLKQRRGEISQADALRDLETLSAIWRGDAIEVKTLQMLSHIYSDTGHFRESLAAARAATRLEPNSEISRQVQDEASALFSQIYLSPKGDDLPPVDALGMFYEFRELTPIGRRGDEMIRRLADRLVAVDLLDQAAELLQYQVDHRLEGAARAQVAAKLAMVYLINRKPDRALSALNSTRIADLSGELRQQRLLLEARAQSDVGRHDLALDIISNINGREAIRLRSDIHWAARRWREASEQIELYYGERWRDFKPLNPVEKGDVVRAVVGYALAEDAIGLARFREKYAPLMSGESDRLAFDIASKPTGGNSADFATIAKLAASVDTLDGFMREMKARFPDATAWTPPVSKTDPGSTGVLPGIVGMKRAEAAR
jgi:tetratricopeptide (TPR) repeat protein